MTKTDEIRIAVIGAGGRMGGALVREIAATEGVALCAAVERPGAPGVGEDAGARAGIGAIGAPITDDPLKAIAHAQAVVDFTRPEASVEVAGLCAQARIVHVLGTTGLTPADDARILAASRHAPIVRSGNMSLGVNLLAALTRKLAATLGEDWDIEIVEMHHRRKVDAPSGTAIMLGEAAAAGRGVDLAQARESGRDGETGARRRGAIGFAALRGGDVVGEHDVIFAADRERLILRHVATDRAIFARGAVRAAVWGQGRPPGLYGMADVLDLS